jgi:tRNA modification GTPase
MNSLAALSISSEADGNLSRVGGKTAADTIFALSSGSPPAAIAVVRISGPRANAALQALAGRLPPPRVAALAALADPISGETLDNGLILRFPAPHSATGEDVAELHLHGGRSVVAAVLAALGSLVGMRPAAAGEFTRRAFDNGRIDLAEAEGLADLLSAETEAQRRAALALAAGSLSRQIEAWQQTVLGLSARIEAAIDFADEGDVGETCLVDVPQWSQLVDELSAALARPAAERLRDGLKIVIAGPPNAGKSSLFNHLAGRQAAIISPLPGTTRDRIEAPVAIDGLPFLLIDTAGLRDSGDAVESVGVGLALDSIASADLILWLGDASACPDPARAIKIAAKADLPAGADPAADIAVSSITGRGIDDLVALLVGRSRALLPKEGEVAINARHRLLLAQCLDHLREAGAADDPIIAAEALRQARLALDAVTGRAGVEQMLDSLFGRFCIGK